MSTQHLAAAAILWWIAAQSAQMPFTTVARGDRSRIEEARQAVARTPAEWAVLWKAHGAKDRTPAVDFRKSMVIAVFSGTRPTAGYSVEITRIERRGADLVVTYRERRPASGDLVAQVLTAPFHVVQADAHAGPVIFQRIP